MAISLPVELVISPVSNVPVLEAPSVTVYAKLPDIAFLLVAKNVNTALFLVTVKCVVSVCAACKAVAICMAVTSAVVCDPSGSKAG